jgi:hypothetical protein
MASGRVYVPALVTLGFAAGCLFGWFAFKKPPERPGQPPPAAPAATKIEVSTGTGDLAMVESFFRTWGGYAVWENDITEIAVVSDQPERSRMGYYQVIRAHRRFFFRTLNRLTRPLIDHGVLVRCPIAFTEPPWMREKYYREHPGETPGTVRIDELIGRALLLPPRPPETGDDAGVQTVPGSGEILSTPRTTPGAGAQQEIPYTVPPPPTEKIPPPPE